MGWKCQRRHPHSAPLSPSSTALPIQQIQWSIYLLMEDLEVVSTSGLQCRAASESVTSQDAMHIYMEVDCIGTSTARVRHRIRVPLIVSSLTIMPVQDIHIQVMM